MDRLTSNASDRLWHYEAYARDQWIKRQADALPAGSWVLDAGAGASKYRPFFSHCRYETQDFCKYEGPLVSYRNPINYICDITTIPLPDRSLDAIVCTEVIEHVIDPMAVLKEFARLLKPGGRLYLTSPLLSHLHMEPFHFFGGFTHYWYRHWLPQHGFRIDDLEPVGGPGRTCIVFVQAFYNSWAEAEKGLGLLPRLFSRTLRAFAKIPAHWTLPRLLPRMDPWLGNDLICSGYLVSATRASEEGSQVGSRESLSIP
jgi:SAM-dependent methyltransferase